MKVNLTSHSMQVGASASGTQVGAIFPRSTMDSSGLEELGGGTGTPRTRPDAEMLGSVISESKAISE